MAQRVAVSRASTAAAAAACRVRGVRNCRCRLPAVPIFLETASTIPTAPAVAGVPGRTRCFANSTVRQGKGGGASPASSPAPIDDLDVGDDEGDECPPWQNPLHHKDPKFDKVFFEDFEPGEEIPIVPLPPFDDGSGKVLATPHVREIAEEVLQLNMMEIMELSNRIGEHFGIEDDGMGVGGGADETGGEGDEAKVEEAEEERTAFDLKLSGFDAKSKIKVIKEVRAITGLGLKEAKEMVEGAPKVVKKDVKMEEAEELKEKLEAVGATVEIV